jgi:hypothetical protein
MDTDGPPGRRLLRAAAGAGAVAAVAAAAVFAYALLIPDGWGWLRVLDTPGKVRHVYALPYLLAGAGYGVLRLASVDVDFVQALSVGRGISAAAGALVVLALLVRASRCGGDWRRAGALVGGALTAIVLTAPVLHAWYVSWGLVLVAACAGDAARRLLLLLCVALCFTAMPGELVHSHAGLALNLALLAAAVVITLLATRPTNAPAPEPPDACAGEAPELVTAEPAAGAPGAR